MFLKKAAVSILVILTILVSYMVGVAPTVAAASAPLEGKTIVLDAGQGEGSDVVFLYYSEHVAMLYLSHAIRQRLESFGATVRLTRPGNANVTLPVRCAWINIWSLEAIRAVTTDPMQIDEINGLISVMMGIVNDPTGAEGRRLMNIPFNASREVHHDLRRIFELQNHPVIRDNFLAISLHSNGAPSPINPAIRGAEVYFINPATNTNTHRYFPGFSFTQESRRFGDILLNHIHMEGIPRRQHGLRAENFFMIREINVPAVLSENGFHTNPQDRAMLMSNEFLGRLANAYVRAIFEHYRIEPPHNEGPWAELPSFTGATGAGSWVRNGAIWQYRFDAGGYATGWLQVDGLLYFFNNSGHMQTGWVRYSDDWYFLRPSGAMSTGWVLSGGHWYFMRTSGAMATGWINDGGIWYYLRSTGAMATGWVEYGNEWYFLRPSGAMASGWVLSGGHWFFMNQSGVMQTGWIQSGGLWYYLQSNGSMATGTITIDGSRHSFAGNGRWLG